MHLIRGRFVCDPCLVDQFDDGTGPEIFDELRERLDAEVRAFRPGAGLGQEADHRLQILDELRLVEIVIDVHRQFCSELAKLGDERLKLKPDAFVTERAKIV